MLEDICRKAHDLRDRLNALGGHLDHAARRTEIEDLESRTARPDLWDDPAAAQALLQRLSQAKEEIAPYEALVARLEDAEVMCQLLAEEGAADEAAERELETEIEAIAAALDRLELETLFSGEHDAADAIVEIKAGAGGTDACDWVTMLQRMYLRWAETNGYRTDILDESEAEIAGLKSTTFIVRGKNAYGYLKAERGVHRLVRISPFDANKRRQTSFAQVDVLPDLGEEVHVDINEDDLEIDTYRSSGAGGQHVNKTDSAVRITHKPTGLVVTCQNERSQHKNKAMALEVLRARLLDREQRESEEKIAALRGETKANEWGSQDRSYVFHPYTLVKDLRTGYETGDVIGVMNGNIGPFLQAYLQWQQTHKERERVG
ncbi:MAG TPA: peptide chain release factor 2 [Chthonomonadaceae bacterium]|nr:peptide chain release factor 2 [Chthonomonadaceae bacterium]